MSIAVLDQKVVLLSPSFTESIRVLVITGGSPKIT